jgi:hypothetical protein
MLVQFSLGLVKSGYFDHFSGKSRPVRHARRELSVVIVSGPGLGTFKSHIHVTWRLFYMYLESIWIWTYLCYDFKYIFAEKFGENIGVICSISVLLVFAKIRS